MPDFSDHFARWLPTADVAQLRLTREKIDLAIVMREDEINQRESELKRALQLERQEVKAAKKALGIKTRKTRKDKGTHRKPKETA